VRKGSNTSAIPSRKAQSFNQMETATYNTDKLLAGFEIVLRTRIKIQVRDGALFPFKKEPREHYTDPKVN
jgi:hypothetical protein